MSNEPISKKTYVSPLITSPESFGLSKKRFIPQGATGDCSNGNTAATMCTSGTTISATFDCTNGSIVTGSCSTGNAGSVGPEDCTTGTAASMSCDGGTNFVV